MANSEWEIAPLPLREGANSSGASRDEFGGGVCELKSPSPELHSLSLAQFAPSREGRGK